MAFAHVASGTGTDQEMLDACRAAIVQVMVNGQEYRDANGNRQTRPDLATLQKMEARLQAKVNGSTNGPANNLVVMSGTRGLGRMAMDEY